MGVHSLKKRDAIIDTITIRARKMSHKNGVAVPASVENFYEIYRNKGNNFWSKSIEKEMHSIRVVFEILDEKDNVPYGWSN